MWIIETVGQVGDSYSVVLPDDVLLSCVWWDLLWCDYCSKDRMKYLYYTEIILTLWRREQREGEKWGGREGKETAKVEGRALVRSCSDLLNYFVWCNHPIINKIMHSSAAHHLLFGTRFHNLAYYSTEISKFTMQQNQLVTVEKWQKIEIRWQQNYWRVLYI